MSRSFSLVTALALVACGGTLRAQLVYVPNGSFELPATVYVSTNINNWQETPQPASWNVDDDGPWGDEVGVFLNTPAGASDHLDDCDGNQAMWLFNVPQVGLFQDYNAVDYNGTTNAFTATYQAGYAYGCVAAFNGGGGGMPSGAPLQFSLYYRDGSGNMVTIATTTVINNLTNFPNHTHLVDYVVQIPVVKPTDPWAGKHIGILFYANTTTALEGGYWDIDNVRLTALLPTVSCWPDGSNVRIWWPSVTGHDYQIQSASGPGTPYSNYDSAQAGTGAFLNDLFPTTGTAQTYFKVIDTP